MRTKYIFVIGGVLSGVGKGVTAASIGRMFKNRGLKVSAMKIDPYINVDAGTMNPVEHGEVFVTDDGYETDQDIGNYERFLDTDILSDNYLTTGRVYESVIHKERSMFYKGHCVQVVPHIPLEVVDSIKRASKRAKADVMIIEIGGTVGEYENILFLEAARMMKLDNPVDVAFVLVSYMPVPGHIGEMKTKPTQHAARALNNSGIQPDFIVARGTTELDTPRREKLAFFCWLKSRDHVISAPDVESIYDIPTVFEKQHFAELLSKGLHFTLPKVVDKKWDSFAKRLKDAKKVIKIAVVGKYFGTGKYTLSDSYISVIEAAKHAAAHNGARPEMTWVDSEDYEKDPKKINELSNYDAIIVPGGFGARGVEGIMMAIRYAREKKIPYLGLCYGMQLATIEFARDVLGLEKANTLEINSQTPDPVIHINGEQAANVKNSRYGGTMRLGAYRCILKKGSRVQKMYGVNEISERHRHRYEFNNAYRKMMEENGVQFVGINPEKNLVEIIELKDHPYFVGSQFHPELKSRPLHPHPLFMGLIKAALKK
ncbi:MAG TPA: CTP synthase [Patescibacteria group bacterium]|nr:CTP synthase [Patescibacteria group bacterium]